MQPIARITLIIFLSFGVYFLLDELYFKVLRTWIHQAIHQIGISHIIAYTLAGLPIFIGVLLLHPKKSFLDSLGLDRSVWKAMAFALLCTLPMFLGFAFVFEPETEISLNNLLISVLAAAFFEELYFRGFLFGQLVKKF